MPSSGCTPGGSSSSTGTISTNPEKKVPEIASWRAFWPLFLSYTYIKNAASLNTLFLTGLNSGALGYVKASARMQRAIENGEFPPVAD
jgi:hypothetical protein